MQPAIREYYHLEELWGDKPVRMKIGAAPPARLVKAGAQPVEERRTSQRRGHAAAPAAERRTAPRRANASAPSAAKVPARRKAAPARHVVRTVGVKSAAKKAASSARPTTTRRPAAKKTSAKR